VFLGADTPISTLTEAARETQPALLVISSFDPTLLETGAAALRKLKRNVPLALAGPGAGEMLSARLGARHLNGDLVVAAAVLAREARA